MKKTMIIFMTISLFFSGLIMATEKAQAVVGKVISTVARKASIETIVWIGKDKAIETIKDKAKEELVDQAQEQFIKKQSFFLYKTPNNKVYNIKRNDSLTSGDNLKFQEALRKKIESKMAVRDPLAENFVGEIVDFFTGYRAVIIGTSLITGMLTQGSKNFLDELVFDTMLDTGLAVPALPVKPNTNNYVNVEGLIWSYTPIDYSSTPNYNDWILDSHSQIGGNGTVTIKKDPVLETYKTITTLPTIDLMGKELSIQNTGNFVPGDLIPLSNLGFSWTNMVSFQNGMKLRIGHQLYPDGTGKMLEFRSEFDNIPNAYTLNPWVAYYNGKKIGSGSDFFYNDPVFSRNLDIDRLFKNLKTTRIYVDRHNKTLVITYSDFSNEFQIYVDTPNLPEVLDPKELVISVQRPLFDDDPDWKVDTRKITRIIDVAPLKIPYKPAQPAPLDVPVKDSPFQNDKEITIPDLPEFPVKNPTTGQDLEIVPDPTTGEPTVIDPETGEPYPEDGPDPIVGEPTVPDPTAPSTPVTPSPDNPTNPDPDNPTDPENPTNPDPNPDPGTNPDPDGTGSPSPAPGPSCSTKELDTSNIKKLGVEFTEAFPFSIPWDIFRAFDLAFGGLSDEKPQFEFAIKNPVSGKAFTFPLGIPDFFDKWQPFVHSVILLTFDVSLIYAMRKWFGGSS